MPIVCDLVCAGVCYKHGRSGDLAVTGPNIAAIGWEACPVEWWIDIADQLERSGAAWVESAALMDLRFWCGQVRLGRRKRIPSRRRLAARWHWTDHAVRCLLRSAQLCPALRRSGQI